MITTKQRIHLMAELWPNACAQQGWDVKDDGRRYELFARILGARDPHKGRLERGEHISCNHFVKTLHRDDFGDVKNELLLLAGSDLLQDNPARRTLLWVIQERLMPCYRLYKADAALDTILRERFGLVKGKWVVEDLKPDALEKLIFTLEARVNTEQNKAGDSHHVMCEKAGVERWKGCPKDCWRCKEEWEARRQKEMSPVEAAQLAEVEEPF